MLSKLSSRGSSRLVLALCAIATGALMLSGAQAWAAEGQPTIVNAQATYITEQGARLEAQIDPGNGETAYEFWLECRSLAGGPCEPIAPQKQGGQIAAGSGERTVSVNVTGLQPGYSYSYGVAASNAAGRVEAHLSFETQQLGACATGCPYKTGVSLQAIELGRLLAEGAPAREAARQQAAKEQAEREAAAKKADQPSTTPTSSPPATVTGSVSLAATSVMVQGNGMALVKLNCLGIVGCRGKLTLMAKSRVRAKGSKRARAVRIGTGSFSIAGDETKTVKVDLNAAGRVLLKADHGHCSASLAILELAPSPQNTQTKTVHLVQQNTHGKTKKGSVA
jgi:hypothetical protein